MGLYGTATGLPIHLTTITVYGYANELYWDCGGPVIPVRAGRNDAKEAGPLGVPGTGGFNRGDMIPVVTCGHTPGGVHGDHHPQHTM
uniref:Uncharacterized protein n=1 Tax=Moniliophthora roreri TaxID=221103 RepID=A0A0W0FQC1_MONRR